MACWKTRENRIKSERKKEKEMRLFFYDLVRCGRDNEEERVVFRFLTANGEKVSIYCDAVRKNVYILPVQGRHDVYDEEWQASVLRFMQGRTHALPEDIRVEGVVERRYILSENHRLSNKHAFLRLSCSIRHDWNFNRHVIEDSPLVSEYLGGDYSIVDQLVNVHRLHAWTEVNDALLVVDAKKKERYTCSYAQLHDIFTSTGDTSQVHPRVSSMVVYKDAETDRYTLKNQQNGAVYSPLNEQNAKSIIARIDPALIVVHNLLNFSDCDAVVINTMELDKIPSVVRSVDDVLSTLKRHNFIELSLDMTVYTWQPWSQTVRNSSRLLHVEWLLHRRFYECGVLSPVKTYRQKEEYAGGLVLPAAVGIHDSPVLLFDFRSLFPSLCVEYSICWSDNGELLPVLFRRLVDERKALQYVENTEIRRQMLKLLTNSIYGSMAATTCRYYSPFIAERITRESRVTLQATADAVTSPGEVIYGDTDSVFVKLSSSPSAMAMIRMYADAFVKKINARYRYLELEHENTYQLIVFVSKKCYVAYPMDEREPPTIKGLKMIKSEYCLLGRYLVETTVKRLGRRRSPTVIMDKCHRETQETLERLRNGSYTLEEITMTRRLNKRLAEYSMSAAPCHVQAALANRCKAYSLGDYVRYAMIEGKKCVCVERLGDQRLDIAWYSTQIGGMIEQLLSLLPGYNSSRFSELLVFNVSSSAMTTQMTTSSSSSRTTMKEELTYERHGLTIECQQCMHSILHYGLYPLERSLGEQRCCSEESGHQVDIRHELSCSHCGCPLNFPKAIDDCLHLGNEWQLASLQLNYDCRRILSLTSCRECRTTITDSLLTVRRLYTDMMNKLYSSN